MVFKEMSELHHSSTSTNLNEILENCNDLMEEIEKLEIQNSSIEILNDVKKNHPRFYDQELVYQNYRTQFSKAYFSGSEWYVGDSYTKWVLDRPFSEEEKVDLVFNAIFGSIIKHYCKSV